MIMRHTGASSSRSQGGGKGRLLCGVAAISIMVTLAAAFTVVLGTEPAAARTKEQGRCTARWTAKAPNRSAMCRKGRCRFLFRSISRSCTSTATARSRRHFGRDRRAAQPTPIGVFSIIQKQVFHRSNIYSGAPMPFMQRITWSGVALHEGENIGHPASHGCIRMPRRFRRAAL